MTFYHRITIENVTEEERTDFLAVGVQLPPGVKARRGAEHVTFDITEDDPRWEKVAAVVAPIEASFRVAHHKTTIPYEDILKRLRQFGSQVQSSELEGLSEYTGQTVEELLALEGKYRIDSLVLAFENAIRKKVDRESIKLTDEERVVLAVEALEREVNNGGYDQFFTNSSREFSPTIVEYLRRIGCKKTANITQRAIKALGVSELTRKQSTW